MQVVRTTTLAEAARAGAERGSRFLGGGTLLMRVANYAPQEITRLVRTTDPALREIRSEGERLRIGAHVTMAQLAAHPDLAFLAPVARVVGGPAIRNMATVGGNLFAPPPYGDLAAALLAAGAEVAWADGRTEPLEGMLQSRATARGLVAAVLVRRIDAREFRFHKVARVKPKGVAVMSLAAHLPMRGPQFGEVRLAWGNMGPAPMRGRAAEAALRGATADARGIEGALRAATDGLEPADDALASAWYRREVAPVHLRRLLLGET